MDYDLGAWQVIPSGSVGFSGGRYVGYSYGRTISPSTHYFNNAYFVYSDGDVGDGYYDYITNSYGRIIAAQKLGR